MIKKLLISLLLVICVVKAFGQNSIHGVVTDAETGESIIGCNILIQGTSFGTITDMKGEYTIKNIPNGTYNVIFSFISYEKKIQKVALSKGNTINTNNIVLKPTSTQIKDVVVTATRRTDTELSLLMSNKASALTVNGISSQQISKSQDKDASEVIRRVPGVSIRDGKFVIVRGLTERYNSVWLNGATTPSSESDVRAFSFDVIPSGQIDNILIYKSAAPELPADFAGAMINIKTKSLIDKNSITFSYSYGNHIGTTGQEFFTYQGGKTDWLGYDDGTRAIPTGVPSTEVFKSLYNQKTDEKIAQINSISKSFNTILTPEKTIAKPDADFQLGINKRFTVGDFSIGSISSLGYNSTNVTENSFRAAYGNQADTLYKYNQNTFQSRVRVSLLSNWVFLFGNNQKIEFRNLFNNYGQSKTILKNGLEFSEGWFRRSYELSYESRTTYSGQLAGTHSFNNDKSKLDWTLGYSYANKNQPDMRRIYTQIGSDADSESKYFMSPANNVDPQGIGRLSMYNEEHIINGCVNFSHKLNILGILPEIKVGLSYELKNRSFSTRVFGYVLGKNKYYQPQINSTIDSTAFSTSFFQSIDKIFKNNIDYNTGMVIAESTNQADSYTAGNKLYAGYLALNIPVSKTFNAYLGLRIEDNIQMLDGFDGAKMKPVSVLNDKLDFFPSINTTYNFSDKMLLRFAAGQTINRPEFREISPFAFYSFEENTTIYGNPLVKNSYISNADLRYEWYPTTEEIVSLGVFYKSFINPIESKILKTGSGWNYTFDNAKDANSYGVELDIRKRLHELEQINSLAFLKNLTFIINASYIKSEINVESSTTERTGKRELQGQSPYILNLGMFYQDLKMLTSVNLMYNIVGKRISMVGDKDTPHIYEMPFNSLDLTLERKITKWMSMKLGVKNILDDEVVFQQLDEFTDPVTKKAKSVTDVRQRFKPGRQFKIAINIIL